MAAGVATNTLSQETFLVRPHPNFAADARMKIWGESTPSRAVNWLRLTPGLMRPTTLSHHQ